MRQGGRADRHGQVESRVFEPGDRKGDVDRLQEGMAGGEVEVTGDTQLDRWIASIHVLRS